ncbi:MAG: hypothetical protein WD670_09340 [Actinomycetota bacterium]
MSTDLEALVKEGRIERVEADTSAARDKLEEAKHHLDSAALIAETDPAGAYSLLYDAARKAVDAHMLMSGYRVSRSRLGGHEATARYASSALGSGPHGESARRFDRMRRNRNRSEYGAWQIGRSTLDADLVHAREIVEAVEESLA